MRRCQLINICFPNSNSTELHQIETAYNFPTLRKGQENAFKTFSSISHIYMNRKSDNNGPVKRIHFARDGLPSRRQRNPHGPWMALKDSLCFTLIWLGGEGRSADPSEEKRSRKEQPRSRTGRRQRGGWKACHKFTKFSKFDGDR